MYLVTVIVKRRPTIVDPQGKAVEQGAKLLGFNNVSNTRIGKYIQFNINTESYETAKNEVEEYCKKLLANMIMEDYEYTLEEIK
ncbi:MAG TPA: phosphoribosylformylglycinamidine synthase subunit PurS [Melioribacteraceae bacterium]|nr:phosphoribosylformylglycinamidine synthase subunit PurS [Melioribacteraceae bacterium]